MYYDTEAGVVDSMRNSLGDYRQQNEDLKNKLLAMRCESISIADYLEQFRGSVHESNAIQRLRKMAE